MAVELTTAYTIPGVSVMASNEGSLPLPPPVQVLLHQHLRAMGNQVDCVHCAGGVTDIPVSSDDSNSPLCWWCHWHSCLL
jgi:hypothetical protein